MSTLAEVLAQGIRIHDGNHDKGAAALGDDLAAVVAEWLTSDDAAVEVVADSLMIHTQFYDVAARHALADLAAHAKGEVS